MAAFMTSATAQAATVSPFRLDANASAVMTGHAPKTPRKQSNRLDPLDGEEFQGIARPDRVLGDDLPLAPTLATADALGVRGLRRMPPPLQIEALAGHNAFDTQRRQRATAGLRVMTTNSVLGVGTTMSYGMPLTRGLIATPFVSLDYLRVDSARIANLNSPYAYVPDNANIGLAVTAGASLAWRFGPSRRFKLTGYGAMVAASGRDDQLDRPLRDFASVSARIVNALGDTHLMAPYADVGASLSYAVVPRVRFSGAVVQTLGHDRGDQLGVRLAMRMRY